MLTFEARGAELSGCGRYRYKLWRIWDPDLPPILFVMLNPSTADANSDDRTIRRCVAFAKRDGFGRLLVGNLFAYRTPYPRVLRKAEEPVGDGNDVALVADVVAGRPNGGSLGSEMAATCPGTSRCLICWGTSGVSG